MNTGCEHVTDETGHCRVMSCENYKGLCRLHKAPTIQPEFVAECNRRDDEDDENRLTPGEMNPDWEGDRQ